MIPIITLKLESKVPTAHMLHHPNKNTQREGVAKLLPLYQKTSLNIGNSLDF